MDRDMRKRLRDQTAALSVVLVAELGAKAGNKRCLTDGQAWIVAMRLGFDLACKMRGISSRPPSFLPFAGTDVLESLPAARLKLCRAIVAECKEAFAAPDALGWLHQYWYDGMRQDIALSARTARVPKVTSAEMIPATQVYTEPYMVDFLVQNTIGALWRDMYPDADMHEMGSLVRAPGKSSKIPVKRLETLSVLDPACGSGNFLLSAFDLLYGLYESQEGGGPENICASILRNNLYGIDIDQQAVAVSRAVLWLKAVERAPGLTRSDLDQLTCNIVAPDSSGDVYTAELGSLVRMNQTEKAKDVLSQLLTRRYDVVITNPPYLDKRDYDRYMRDYLRTNYPDGAGNLYAAFILRSLELTDYYAGLVTPQTFLFIKSYAALRRRIFTEASVSVLAHLGLGAFQEAVVDPVLTVLRKSTLDQGTKTGVYFKLIDAWPKEQALFEALRDYNDGQPSPHIFIRDMRETTALPGQPVTYWLGDGMRTVLEKSKPLKDYADVVLGMKTSDNKRFVRLWWEVWDTAAGRSRAGWAAYDKEASGYRFSRNAIHVVRWTKAAQAFYSSYYSAQLPNQKYWLRPGIVYGLVSSKAFTAKQLPAGHMTDMAASCVFPHDNTNDGLFLALLNSKLYQWLLRLFNPTVNYQPADLQRLPVPELERQEAEALGLLATQAAEAARQLRSQELIDPEYILSPSEYLPLSEGVPKIIDGLWRQALKFIAARDAIDLILAEQFALPEAEKKRIADDLGLIPSEYPALDGYDTVPAEAEGPIKLSGQRTCLPEGPFALKETLRRRYVRGPGQGQLVEDFFEELTREAALHPISVYRLLRESSADQGWRCAPLAKQLAEDFFSAVAMDIMGHRWGREAKGTSVLAGIVPLVEDTGLPTLATLVRERLQPFYKGLTSLDSDFIQAVGMSLDDWLLGAFFRRHISRFRKRPPLWQISSQQGRGRPAFACLLHHEQANRLREYIVPVLAQLRVKGITKGTYLTELCGFSERLEGLADYHPQVDFGIRLNIAPVQAAGILAENVLSPVDLEAALADYRRAHEFPESYLL